MRGLAYAIAVIAAVGIMIGIAPIAPAILGRIGRDRDRRCSDARSDERSWHIDFERTEHALRVRLFSSRQGSDRKC